MFLGESVSDTIQYHVDSKARLPDLPYSTCSTAARNPSDRSSHFNRIDQLNMHRANSNAIYDESTDRKCQFCQEWKQKIFLRPRLKILNRTLGYSLIELLIALSIGTASLLFIHGYYAVVGNKVANWSQTVNNITSASELRAFLSQKFQDISDASCMGSSAVHLEVLRSTGNQKLSDFDWPLEMSASLGRTKPPVDSKVLFASFPAGTLKYNLANGSVILGDWLGIDAIDRWFEDAFGDGRWFALTDCTSLELAFLAYWNQVSRELYFDNLRIDQLDEKGWLHKLQTIVLFVKPNKFDSSLVDLYYHDGDHSHQLLDKLSHWDINLEANILRFSLRVDRFNARDSLNVSPDRYWNFEIPF